MRHEGARFLLLLQDSSQEYAEAVAERIIHVVNYNPSHLDGKEFEITISIGAACFPETAQNSKSLIKSSLEALSYAQQGGAVNQLCFMGGGIMKFNIFKRLRSWMGPNIAMDLGTANTLVYTRNAGIVLDEPSVVALNSKNGGSVLAVGKKAKEMYGRTPDSIRTIRPMKDGVIADFDVTKAMIRLLLEQLSPKGLSVDLQ